MKAFFYHYSLQFGVQEGYDFIEDYAEFVERNKRAYKRSVCFTLTSLELDISEWDIYTLSTGDKTEVAETFLQYLIGVAQNGMDKGRDLNTPILVSMHSGSSDYLTIKKLLD